MDEWLRERVALSGGKLRAWLGRRLAFVTDTDADITVRFDLLNLRVWDDKDREIARLQVQWDEGRPAVVGECVWGGSARVLRALGDALVTTTINERAGR